MELSVWYEHQWRLNPDTYGFNNELSISPNLDLYWIYAGLNYTFTNSGQKIEFAATVGGSSGADRFSAWRLGGVLPLISEFPLMMPGYYYEELTAEQFAHVYAAYEFPLVPSQVLKFRVEAAVAKLVYLPGFEQDPWQSGAGCALSFAPKTGTSKSSCVTAMASKPSEMVMKAHKASACCFNMILEHAREEMTDFHQCEMA